MPKSQPPERSLHRPVSACKYPVASALHEVEEDASVERLCRGASQSEADGVGRGALGTEAHYVAPVEEAERRPAALAPCAPQPALEVACDPRSLLHGDGGGRGQGTVARVGVPSGVTEDVDLGVIRQGEVLVHERAASGVVLPWQPPYQWRSLYTGRPHPGGCSQPLLA